MAPLKPILNTMKIPMKFNEALYTVVRNPLIPRLASRFWYGVQAMLLSRLKIAPIMMIAIRLWEPEPMQRT